MNIEKQIEKIINNTFANCWVDKRSDIAHIHKKMVEELKWELSTIIQKERENAVRDFASYYQADPLRVMEYLSQTKGDKK